MTTIQENLAALFQRDLSRLMQQIDAFPNDDLLWRKLPGVSNPAGNLVLHLEGNLREYVGRQLGKVPYSRQRPLEFSSSGMSVDELSGRVADLRRIVPQTILSLSRTDMEAEFPEVVLDRPTSTGEFLIHLHGHLNWHLGQIDYLRRVLTGSGAGTGAIKAVGLLGSYRLE